MSEKVTLGDLCSLQTEIETPAESKRLIYVGLEHVASGEFQLSRWASPKEFRSNAFVFERGDVLYGKLRPYLDKAVAVQSDGLCSTELLVLRPRPGTPPEYLLAVLHSPEFVAYAQSSADKQYPRTSWNWISQFRCPTHDQETKKEIAAVLSKVQEAVEVEGELVSITRELKQAALRQLFTRGLRGEPQKETEIGPVPESWEVTTIGQHCILSSGGTPDRRAPEFWANGKIPWVKTGEINYRPIASTEEHITELGLANSAAKLLPAGTLVMAMYGQGVTRGRVAVLSIEAATNQACAAIRPKTEHALSTEFLYQFLSHSYENIRALGHGANQTNLNLEIVRDLQIPLPDPDEQREIASILRTIDDKIAFHEEHQRLLRELFRTLLHDLMTGRRRVRLDTASSPEGAA